MALPVECRACGQIHDPLRPCPPRQSRPVILPTPKLDPVSVPRPAFTDVPGPTSTDKQAFDRRAYQRNYMRQYRARLKARQALTDKN